MYRYRQTHKQLSGKYAALNGKKITWEHNVAPADTTSPWVTMTGKIVSVAPDGQSYFVDDHANGSRHWVGAKWDQYRNIEVQSDEAVALARINANMEGWSEPADQ